MSTEHAEETLYAELLRAGLDPEFAAGIASGYRELVEAEHGIPERTMRNCIDMIRRSRRPVERPADSREEE